MMYLASSSDRMVKQAHVTAQFKLREAKPLPSHAFNDATSFRLIMMTQTIQHLNDRNTV